MRTRTIKMQKKYFEILVLESTVHYSYNPLRVLLDYGLPPCLEALVYKSLPGKSQPAK